MYLWRMLIGTSVLLGCIVGSLIAVSLECLSDDYIMGE